MSKGSDERRGEMEEIEEKKGDGGGGGRSRQRDRKEKMRGEGEGRKEEEGEGRKKKEKIFTHTIGQETFADIKFSLYLQFDLYRKNSVCEIIIATLRMLTSQPHS